MPPHRHRPRENMAVNTYWMCDEGMLSYDRVTEGRVLSARAAGARDETLHAVLFAFLDPLDQQVGRTVGRQRARIVADAEVLELLGGVFHHIPVAGAAHDDTDGNLAHVFVIPG